MERVCEEALRNFLTANPGRFCSVRVDTTNVDGDDSQPIKWTREIFTKLQGSSVASIFEAGFHAGLEAKPCQHQQ